MRSVPLGVRIACVIVLAAFALVAGSIAVCEAVWRQALYEEGLASAEATASDVAQVIDENLEFGISLDSLANMQSLLTRTQRGNQSIGFIAVLDRAGVIVFDTETPHIGEMQPQAWALPATISSVWSRIGTDALYAAAPLRDSYQGMAGSVVVAYRTTDIETKLAGSLLQMVWTGVLLLLAVVIASAVAGVLLTRDLRAWSIRLRAQVDGAGAATDASPTAPLAIILRSSEAALIQCQQDLIRLGTSSDGRV